MAEEIVLAMEIGIKLINFIGKSFDEAESITELTNVLEGLGFEDKGERKLGGDKKDSRYKYDKNRCEKYSCKEKSKGKTITHRCLGGIYIFSITDKNDEKINLDSFTKLWNERTTTNIPLVNEKYNDKYLYVGKDINNLNNRISNHFGKGGGSTYALKLASEDKTESEDKATKPKIKDYNITCHRFTLNYDFPEYARAGYIAMIESILHEKLKPILGKK